MLAIGRSVFRARLHSSLPVTTSWTAADRAPTPAGPLLAEAALAAEAGASTLAARAIPAIKPVTRAVSQPLVPMTSPLRSQQTTGASLSVTAPSGKRPRSGADPVQVDSLQLIFQTLASEGTHDRDDAAPGGSAQGRRGPRPGRFRRGRVPRHSLRRAAVRRQPDAPAAAGSGLDGRAGRHLVRPDRAQGGLPAAVPAAVPRGGDPGRGLP